MKKLFILFILIVYPFTNLFADDIDNQMQGILSDLSAKYLEKHPVKTDKFGLAVLPFENKSQAAIDASIGETIREALSRIVVRSNVFYLVDRDIVEQSMKEMELSMTGAVKDNDIIKAGNLAGVRVFLCGTVTEERDSFVINARLVDVETGIVVAVTKGEIPANRLMEKREQFAYEYISQYGLGINSQFAFAPMIKTPRDGSMTTVLDVFMNYRPYLWLNFKLGITFFNMTYTKEEVGLASKLYPNASDHESANSYNEFNSSVMHVKNADISEFGPYFGFDINWTPRQFFSLGFGAAISMITPVIENVYNNGWVWDASADPNNDGTSEGDFKHIEGFIVEQHLDPVTMFRFEIKPQFFVSPRFTVGLYFAYLYSTPLNVSRTTINSEYTISNQFTVNEEMEKKYMGLKAESLGLGHNIEDVKLQGPMIGFSLNFFF